MKVLVLGDLCLDTVVEDELSLDSSLAGDGRDLSLWTSLADIPGGTSYHFATAAGQRGFTPVVAGAVGGDVAGELIVAALNDKAIRHHVAIDDQRPTGRAVIAYSAAGSRVMFASRRTANEGLCGPVVREVLDSLPDFDAIWLSGLSLSRKASLTYDSVLKIAAGGRDHGIRLLIDIVPHEFHHHFRDIPAIEAEIGSIHGLVSELSSARRLLGLGDRRETLTDRVLDETADLMLEHVTATALRYRAGSTYRQAVRTRSGTSRNLERPVPGRLGLRGYGDTLTCEILTDLVGTRGGTTPQGKA